LNAVRGRFFLGCLTGFFGGNLLLAVLLVGGLMLFQEPLTRMLAAQRAGRLKPPPLVEQAEGLYDLNLRALDQAPRALSASRGKAVFLHFWNPACTSCLSEIPALNALHDGFSSDKVVMLAVSTGTLDETKVAAGVCGGWRTAGTVPCAQHAGDLHTQSRRRHCLPARRLRQLG
jgi:thiol-disulfide isomerase/thioredoxin